VVLVSAMREAGVGEFEREWLAEDRGGRRIHVFSLYRTLAAIRNGR
jgi:hypothetical protein